MHKETDPRVPRAVRSSPRSSTCSARTCGCSRSWPTVSAEQTGRRLPINGAGVAGAALADLGFDWRIIRGFALLARTAGLLGHLAEEMRTPMAMPLWQAVEGGAAED